MPPKRRRQSIFEKHHDGQRLLNEIITNKISKTAAAKILNCSISNITMYMKRHNLKVQDKSPPSSPPKKPLNLTKSPRKPKSKKNPPKASPNKPLNELADQTIELTEDQLKYLSPTDIKELQQLLIDQIRNGAIDIDFDQFMALSKEVYRHYALQLKHDLTNKQEDQIIRLDEKDVEELLAKIEEDHCHTCDYYQYFMQNRNSETEKERLVPE